MSRPASPVRRAPRRARAATVSATAALAAAAILLAACGTDPSGPPPAAPPALRLQVTAGDLQVGDAEQELPTPLRVQVTDAAGRAVAGQVVNFRVVAGGGTVWAGSAATDRDGRAAERWTLGPASPDTQRVEVRAVDPVTGAAVVHATFRALTASRGGVGVYLQAVSGDGARCPVGTFACRFTLRAVDAAGRPQAGVRVEWSVPTAGPLTITGTTDAQGLASAANVYTHLGAGSYRQVARAESGGGQASFAFEQYRSTPVAIQKVQGDGARCAVGTFDCAFRVRLVDASNLPVVGWDVTWSTPAGGSATYADRTDLDGESDATNVYTFPTPGTYTQSARADGTSLVATFAFSLVSGGGGTTPPATYRVAAQVLGTGGGSIQSVSPNGAIRCFKDGGSSSPNYSGAGGACAATYAAGTVLTLQASATNSDTRFTAWGGACAAAGTADLCRLTVTADATVTATFTAGTNGTGGTGGTGTGGAGARTATLVVRNDLLAPINITVNGASVGSVPAQSTRQTTSTAASIVLGWSLVRPTTSSGTPLGETMAGTFAASTNGGGTISYTVDNVVGSTWYFAPLVTNESSAALLLGVNMGLQSESRCNCTAGAGSSRVFFGYYRLYTNGNVRGYRAGSGYTGPFVYWDNLAGDVARGSGELLLRTTRSP